MKLNTKQRRFIVMPLLLLTLVFTLYKLQARERRISLSALPATAQEFFKDHFDGRVVRYVKYSKEDNEYTITLATGTKIEFDSSGIWQEIDCDNDDCVPTSIFSIMPKDVVTWLNDYSNRGYRIVEIKRNDDYEDHYRYKIKMIDPYGVAKQILV